MQHQLKLLNEYTNFIDEIWCNGDQIRFALFHGKARNEMAYSVALFSGMERLLYFSEIFFVQMSRAAYYGVFIYLFYLFIY